MPSPYQCGYDRDSQGLGVILHIRVKIRVRVARVRVCGQHDQDNGAMVLRNVFAC